MRWIPSFIISKKKKMRNIGGSGSGSGSELLQILVVVMVIVCLMLQDVRFVIMLLWFLRGCGWSQSLFPTFWSFLKFSIVPKPRLMQWIRLPWLPFGMDLPIKEPLVGILPIVFVVFQLEKSLSCKEPPPVLLPISSFSHSQFLSLISLLFWHHHFNCLSGWKGFAESGTGWDNFHWDWDAHIFDLSVSEFCLLSSFWGRCFCQFTLWASVCCRYFDVNSLSGTIPTEIGMLTSLTNLWVNSASCHLFEGRCFWCNWLCGLLFAVGIWIRTSWAEPFPLRFGCSQLWPYCEWILPLVTFSGGISDPIYSLGFLPSFFLVGILMAFRCATMSTTRLGQKPTTMR